MRKYNVLGKAEKWIIKHSFVFIWFPICLLWETLLIIPIFTFYPLGITLIIPFSWDGHCSKNLGKFTVNFFSIYIESSAFITYLNSTEEDEDEDAEELYG